MTGSGAEAVTVVLEASPTSRSTCVGCGGKISAGALRLGLPKGTKQHTWRHFPECTTPAVVASVGDLAVVAGVDDLEEETRSEVARVWNLLTKVLAPEPDEEEEDEKKDKDLAVPAPETPAIPPVEEKAVAATPETAEAATATEAPVAAAAEAETQGDDSAEPAAKRAKPGPELEAGAPSDGDEQFLLARDDFDDMIVDPGAVE